MHFFCDKNINHCMHFEADNLLPPPMTDVVLVAFTCQLNSDVFAHSISGPRPPLA